MVDTLELDELDREVLAILMSDCTKSAREIARILGKSPTTIANRLRKLFATGVVERCSAIVDRKRLGYAITALIMLNVEGAYIEDVERIVANHPNVKAVYDITGDFDVAVIAVFRSVDELDKFIKSVLKIPYVKRSVTSIVLRVVKEEPSIDIQLVKR